MVPHSGKVKTIDMMKCFRTENNNHKIIINYYHDLLAQLGLLNLVTGVLICSMIFNYSMVYSTWKALLNVMSEFTDEYMK